MLKEVIIVPKDRCPLDVLAEMGSKTRNAWIFLHRSAIKKLRRQADVVTGCNSFEEMRWKETEYCPKTTILLEFPKEEWVRVFKIEAEDIAFNQEVRTPKYLLYLKMAD